MSAPERVPVWAHVAAVVLVLVMAVVILSVTSAIVAGCLALVRLVVGWLT